MAEADPYRAYNFKLDIQGMVVGHFASCKGLGVKIQAIPYREGGAGAAVRRLPGRVEYGDVTLGYGLTDSRDLWDWLMAAAQGRIERKNVSIILLDTDGIREVVRWNLNNAWAAEWRGAPLEALGQEIAIESLTLVFETLERA